MKSVVAVVVVGVLLACTRVVLCQDPCKRYDVDGCTVPKYLPQIYTNFFAPACNRHDVCYLCGNRFGISRPKCDSVFYDKMKALCRLPHHQPLGTDLTGGCPETDARALCEGMAYLYYAAVRLFGCSRYRIPSAHYCNESWVKQCLPNKFPLLDKIRQRRSVV